jgi:hypothetical protein
METGKTPEVEQHGLHKEVVHDHDVLGNKHVTKEDATHAAELTAEEHALERKLRIKIDIMIMPWVILVSCLITLSIVEPMLTHAANAGVSFELH